MDQDQNIESSNQANLGDKNPSEQYQPEMNFFTYITSLAFQALIFLGEVDNPITNKKEKNIKQAKLLIDTLVIIREKTEGNLTHEEADILNNYLYELQMKYVQAVHSKP